MIPVWLSDIPNHIPQTLFISLACSNSFGAELMVHVNYSFQGFRIGFESITYTVDEGIGSFMVCVRMFEPSPETVIGLTINVAVETFPETAGE